MIVEHPVPMTAAANLNRVPFAGVAGKGCCEPGAGEGGDALTATGDAIGERLGDASGDAIDDAFGEAGGEAGKAGGEGAGEAAEELPGVGSGDTPDKEVALAPATKLNCSGGRQSKYHQIQHLWHIMPNQSFPWQYCSHTVLGSQFVKHLTR